MVSIFGPSILQNLRLYLNVKLFSDQLAHTMRSGPWDAGSPQSSGGLQTEAKLRLFLAVRLFVFGERRKRYTKEPERRLGEVGIFDFHGHRFAAARVQRPAHKVARLQSARRGVYGHLQNKVRSSTLKQA